jgi:hypothetical protein
MHRFSQSLCQGIKGTCGFIQRVQSGARRAILAQKKIDPETGRSYNLAEVGGLHHVVSEPLFICRLQAEGGRVDKENTLIHTIMWYQSQHIFCLHIIDKRRTVKGYSLIPSCGIRDDIFICKLQAKDIAGEGGDRVMMLCEYCCNMCNSQ